MYSYYNVKYIPVWMVNNMNIRDELLTIIKTAEDKEVTALLAFIKENKDKKIRDLLVLHKSLN